MVKIARIAALCRRQQNPAALRRIWSAAELARAGQSGLDSLAAAASLAAAFAAREAAAKALGTGLGREGVSLADFAVDHEPSGRPYLRVQGAAKAHMNRLGLTAVELSLSHDGDYALASVIMWGEGKRPEPLSPAQSE